MSCPPDGLTWEEWAEIDPDAFQSAVADYQWDRGVEDWYIARGK